MPVFLRARVSACLRADEQCNIPAYVHPCMHHACVRACARRHRQAGTQEKQAEKLLPGIDCGAYVHWLLLLRRLVSLVGECPPPPLPRATLQSLKQPSVMGPHALDGQDDEGPSSLRMKTHFNSARETGKYNCMLCVRVPGSEESKTGRSLRNGASERATRWGASASASERRCKKAADPSACEA